MKRMVCCMLALCAACIYISCKRNVSRAGTFSPAPQNAVKDVLPKREAPPKEMPRATENVAQNGGPLPSVPQYGAVDVDLTKLGSTLIYGEVFNMFIEPERYDGKTVRMKGAFYPIEDAPFTHETPGFACIIADATACCAQGLEFTPVAAYSYPTDFPAPYTEVTVSGRYYSYEEDGLLYCGLADAVFE